MGAFKPLLPFGNKTVIECCIDYLRAGGAETIVVVLGHRANEIRERLKQVDFAINPDPNSEMADSIRVGLQALPETTKAVVIAPADHPAIPAHVVSMLIAEWKNGARLVIPTWQGRGGHPVLIDLSYRTQLLNLDPAGGLRTLFDAHRDEVKRIAVDSPFIARDMDTWDDYRALHNEAVGEPPPDPVKMVNESTGGLI
jgi:molybdenum cofactor cytidylyltransferase